MRQLNKYDFHKIRANAGDSSSLLYGDNAWEFKHPDFQLHNKDQIDNIKRKAVNSRKQVGRPNGGNGSNGDGGAPGLNLQQQAVGRDGAQLGGQPAGGSGSGLTDYATAQRVQHLESELSAMRVAQSELTRELRTLRDQHATTQHRLLTLQEAHKVSDEVLRQLLVLESTSAQQANNSGGRVGGGNYAQILDLLTTLNTTEAARNDVPIRQTLPPLSGAPISKPVYQPPLPQQQQHQLQQGSFQPQQIQADAPQSRAPQQHSYLVLLVEDDDLSVKVCRKFLTEYGCQVDVANDGVTAVKRAQSCTYDLILMEIVMPQLNGLSATELIREGEREREREREQEQLGMRPAGETGGGSSSSRAAGGRKGTPIVAMTSMTGTTQAEMMNYYRRGVTDMLAKPFTRDDLVQLLDLYLKPARANDDDERGEDGAGGELEAPDDGENDDGNEDDESGNNNNDNNGDEEEEDDGSYGGGDGDEMRTDGGMPVVLPPLGDVGGGPGLATDYYGGLERRGGMADEDAGQQQQAGRPSRKKTRLF